jgi:hypothetical protein
MMEQTITPNTEPEFLEFAAIQIYAAMLQIPGGVGIGSQYSQAWERSGMTIYEEAWARAHRLYAAKRVSEPLELLQAKMESDSDLAWAWHSNIAVAFMDEGGSHKQANEAAARFMLSAFGVDVRLSDQWKNMVAMINTDE